MWLPNTSTVRRINPETDTAVYRYKNEQDVFNVVKTSADTTRIISRRTEVENQ